MTANNNDKVNKSTGSDGGFSLSLPMPITCDMIDDQTGDTVCFSVSGAKRPKSGGKVVGFPVEKKKTTKRSDVTKRGRGRPPTTDRGIAKAAKRVTGENNLFASSVPTPGSESKKRGSGSFASSAPDTSAKKKKGDPRVFNILELNHTTAKIRIENYYTDREVERYNKEVLVLQSQLEYLFRDNRALEAARV